LTACCPNREAVIFHCQGRIEMSSFFVSICISSSSRGCSNSSGTGIWGQFHRVRLFHIRNPTAPHRLPPTNPQPQLTNLHRSRPIELSCITYITNACESMDSRPRSPGRSRGQTRSGTGFVIGDIVINHPHSSSARGRRVAFRRGRPFP